MYHARKNRTMATQQANTVSCNVVVTVCGIAEALPAGHKRKRVQTKLFGDDYVREDLKPGRGPRRRKVGALLPYKTHRACLIEHANKCSGCLSSVARTQSVSTYRDECMPALCSKKGGGGVGEAGMRAVLMLLNAHVTAICTHTYTIIQGGVHTCLRHKSCCGVSW